MSGPEKPIERATAPVHAGVVCAKCEHLNAHGRNVCEACGAHLHVVCHNCGHRNARVSLHCVECGHKLHRSLARRLARRFPGKNGKMSLWQIILLIVCVLVGIGVIIFFDRMPAPPAF